MVKYNVTRLSHDGEQLEKHINVAEKDLAALIMFIAPRLSVIMREYLRIRRIS